MRAGCRGSHAIRHPARRARAATQLAAAAHAMSAAGGMSMRLQVALVGVALSAIASAACDVHVGPGEHVQGSGTVKTESRDVHGFDRVDLAGTGTLVIS